METISFSNEHTKNNGFSLLKRSLKGGACPVAKAQHQNLISLTDLVKSSLTLLPVPSLREAPPDTVAWELQETGIHMENTQSREHRVCHAALSAKARQHRIARLSNGSPQYFPFICTIWSTHFIPMGREVWREQEFTSVNREIMQCHPLQRGKELLLLITPRFPSKHRQNPVCHQALE